MSSFETVGTFCFQPVKIKCDGQCKKAWGLNWKGAKKEEAPEDPGTYEGEDAKPLPPYPPARHNKWCVRECERSIMERL